MRWRTTLAAVAVVGVALTVAAVALVMVTRERLIDDVRAAAGLRAAEVAAGLDAGGPAALAVDDGDEQLIQVVTGDGTVVAASDGAVGGPPVARLAPGESARVRPGGRDDEFVAVAAGTAGAAGPAGTAGAAGPGTVVVARSLDDVMESTSVLATLLAAGVPLLLVVVGVTTWKVVGRALAPVEAIRSGVAAISAGDLHRRVPVPPGQDEIARLAGTMNRMVARLEEAQRRQRRFVSDASHELRSPIAAIRQHAEVALAHPDRSEPGELARVVHGEILRVQELVEDLLLLARADEGSLPLRRVQVDLDDLVLDEARQLRRTTGLRVRTDGVSAGRVEADPGSLRRVLRNLGDNAARHAASTVAFGVAARDGSVALTVDDDGPGIPASEWTRVLERFVRLDDARARDAGGAGLGLAIVAELVAAHGGSVAVSGSPLGGARVAVRLPAAAAEGSG